MVLLESDAALPQRRRLGRLLYICIFIVSTGLVSVILSIRGNIPFEPLTALVAGLFAGLALSIFHLTYLKFVVKSTHTIRSNNEAKEPEII